MAISLDLTQIPGEYGIARLAAGASFPGWADGEGIVNIARTMDEVSVVCLAARIPADVRRDLGWTLIKFEGPFDFAETGILLSVIAPLSAAGIGVFAFSTFDTDYLMVKIAAFPRVTELLRAAGHRIG